MGFFGFDEAKEAHSQLYSDDDNTNPKFSHELLGGAAAFEAMHMWEKEQRREGRPVSHGVAKEALAALAGAEVDKVIERKGLERHVNREEARRHAEENARELYDRQYGEREMYNPEVEIHESMRGYNY
ncbi:hypothetical protein N0V85_001686 [Neurospora sp. IMI 360204]|nr:hypothetical protein N0V85_001686 [Neurospora sp. IMI 360204]